MHSIPFDVQGFSRTYWDLFLGAGFFVSVFLLFAAVLAWQLSGLLAESMGHMRSSAWALALCFLSHDDLELEILLHSAYRFLDPNYAVLDRCSMAFREAQLDFMMLAALTVTKVPSNQVSGQWEYLAAHFKRLVYSIHVQISEWFHCSRLSIMRAQ
jgi:hypothetical protein